MIYIIIPQWLAILLVVVLSLIGCFLLIRDYLATIIIKHFEKKELIEDFIKENSDEK